MRRLVFSCLFPCDQVAAWCPDTESFGPGKQRVSASVFALVSVSVGVLARVLVGVLVGVLVSV